MIRLTEADFRRLKSRNFKIKVRPARPTFITQRKNTKCIVCGNPLPENRQKYCCDKCEHGTGSVRGPYGKVKEPKGLKLNHCRYCGKRADSKDMRVSRPDSFGVKWFRCCCHPEEAQLYDRVDMSGNVNSEVADATRV